MKYNLHPDLKELIPDGFKMDLGTYLVIEYVAKAVSEEGNSFEFKLKIHPQSDKVPFLDSNHLLHNFYKFLLKNPQFYLYNYDKNQIPELLHELYEHSFSNYKDTVNTTDKIKNENIIEGYSDSD